MTTDLFNYKKYLLAGLFLIPFVSAPRLCYSEETSEEMHKWAPVAGRVFLDYDSKNDDYILNAEFIWDSIDGFTSPEKINADKKSHAFEMSFIFNDCKTIMEGKNSDMLNEYCDTTKPKFSTFLECGKTEKKIYYLTSTIIENWSVNIGEQSILECSDSSLIDNNFPKEAGLYIDTRAVDEILSPGAREFAFGIYDASKVTPKKVYYVKFKLKKDQGVLSAPVLVKVNKGFDISLDATDRKYDFYADLLDKHLTLSNEDLLEFCCKNSSIRKDAVCERTGSSAMDGYYDIGQKQACVYEEYLGHDKNIIIDAQRKKYRFCNADCFLSSGDEADKTCYKDCYDLNARKNSVYLTWCLDSKDDNLVGSDAGEPVDVPKRKKLDGKLVIVPAFQVQLLQCSDIDYRKIKPEKSAWYNLTLPIPPGTNFDFIIYNQDGVSLCSATQKTDLNIRNTTPEKCTVFLEEGIEYLVGFYSDAKFTNPYGGWYSDFTVSYFEPFSDVLGDKWYSNAVSALYLTKVIDGYEGSAKFHPDDPINRAQFMKMLINTIAASPSFGKNVFKDKCNCLSSYADRPASCTPVNDWKKRVVYCGLGYPATDNPIYFWKNYTEKDLESTLTKEEAAQVLAIALGLDEKCSFGDCEDYIKMCRKLNENLFIRSDGVVDPTKELTRGEAASVLVKAFFTEDYIRNIKDIRKK